MVGCIYSVDVETPGMVRVGIVVSSRHLNAVRRNRIRRILREAYRRSWAELGRTVAGASRSVELLFIYRPRQRTEADRVTLRDLLPDVASACRTIAARLMRS
jgi:RNase P protein component